jgi:hypothetical protein
MFWGAAKDLKKSILEKEIVFEGNRLEGREGKSFLKGVAHPCAKQ